MNLIKTRVWISVKQDIRPSAKPEEGKRGIGANQVDTYHIDVKKGKRCPLKEGCYKEGANSKTYSLSLEFNEHFE